ncbi:MAG: OmpA family protein [Verrucomicrobiota bacterium]
MLGRIDRQAGKTFIYSAFGVILLVFWIWFAAAVRPALEGKLTERTKLALASNGVNFPLDIAFRGRVGTISGMVSGVDGLNQLEQVLGLIDVPGAAKLELEVGAIPEEEPATLPWARFELSDGTIRVSGELPQSLEEQFAESFEGSRQRVDLADLKFGERVLREAWVERLEDFSGALRKTVRNGSVEVRPTAVSASGIFERTEDRDQFAAALVAFAAVNLEHSMDLKIVQAPSEPILEFFADGDEIKVVRGKLPKTRVSGDFVDLLEEIGVRGVELIEREEHVQSPRWLVGAGSWVPDLLAKLSDGELIIDGRDFFVRGVPKPGEIANVSALMDVVRSQSGLNIVEESLSNPAPPPEPVEAELSIVWSAEGNVEFEGNLPDDQSGQALLKALSNAFPEADDSSILLATHVKQAKWIGLQKRWIPVMAALGHGSMKAVGSELTIEGEALSSSDAEVITSTESKLKDDGLDVEFLIAIPASPVVAINGEEMKPEPMISLEIPVEEPASEAEEENVEEKTAKVILLPENLGELQGYGSVRFVFSGTSALLEDEDNSRLENIADQLREKDLSLIVAGFAKPDSTGYVRWLNQRRADEVWRLLIAYGIDANRLESAVYQPRDSMTEPELERSVVLFAPAEGSQGPNASSSGEMDQRQMIDEPVIAETALPEPEPEVAEESEAPNSKTGGELVGIIYFGHGTAMVKAPQKEAMVPIAAKLKDFPADTRFVAAGFADPSGDPEFNRWLSGERAVSVRGMMANAGVASSRVETRVYGSSNLQGNVETEQGQALNRRVEIRTWYADP